MKMVVKDQLISRGLVKVINRTQKQTTVVVFLAKRIKRGQIKNAVYVSQNRIL